MEEVFHLVAPKLALVFYFSLVGEILYDQYRLIGDFGLLDTKFKEFFLWSMLPVESDKFLKFTLHHIGPVGRSVPGEGKYIITFIYFICKPFL